VPNCETDQRIPRKWIFVIALALFIMTTILCFNSLLSSFAAAIEKVDPYEIKQHYSPELIYCSQDPTHPDPHQPVEIYANFFDKYSNIHNATLFYSINEDQQRGSEQMRLVNGIPSNGTYLGTIPPQNETATVNYHIEAKDELNYTFISEFGIKESPEGFCQGEYNVTDLKILGFHPTDEPREYKQVVISADIKDSDTGIKNVTLYYRTEPFDKNKFESALEQTTASNSVDYTMVQMSRINDLPYNATIPPVSVNTSVYYFIEANDREGNTDRSIISDYSTESYTHEYPSWCKEEENKIDISSKLQGLDFNDYVANIQFSVSGYPIDKSLFSIQNNQNDQEYPNYYFKSFDSFSNEHKYDLYGYGRYLEGISIEDKEVKDIFDFALLQDEESADDCGSRGYQSIRNANNTGFDSVSIPISGDPLRFPFDDYYINLILDVPYRNITFGYTDEHSNLFNTGFSYFSVIENISSLNLNPDCKTENVSQTWLCQKDLQNASTIMNVKYNFNRAYSIATVTVPIVAIFYLLGAIFLFENSSENIGKRLTLTLGIFALIFTLPNIINSLKPLTSSPTIADSMLSIIIIAAIAFTISSILSSSSILQKWFPRRYSWIDGIVFIIISGFVISYFSNYLFDSELWWLIPLIIFGLGYGLLLRALGVKIKRPLLNIKNGKNM
jgi:hypothetical protein